MKNINTTILESLNTLNPVIEAVATQVNAPTFPSCFSSFEEYQNELYAIEDYRSDFYSNDLPKNEYKPWIWEAKPLKIWWIWK